MSDFNHRLDRHMVIRARPDIVFTFLTESSRWAAWWGTGSEIEPRPGGRMFIRHPNGVEVNGEVLEVHPPERIVLRYEVTPPGSKSPADSRVTIELQPHADGTALHLWHEFTDAPTRDQFVQGWRFQLSLFANLVANTVNDQAAAAVDRWCAAWSNPDADTRNRELDAIVSADVHFYDRYSTIHGLEELRAHLAAVHRFMPGVRLQRTGDVRHCQWRVLSDWKATGVDQQPRGTGTNSFVFDADGRIREVTGFWAG